MSKQTTISTPFLLKGRTCILIGGYFIIGAFAIDTLLSEFLVDNSPIMFLSPQIVEILIELILFLFTIFSSGSLYIKEKKIAKIEKTKIWNKSRKKVLLKYSISLLFMSFVLLYLTHEQSLELITPVFLGMYGGLLLLFKTTWTINNIVLISVAFLLSFLTFIIPSYWISALYILGIAHFIYGIINKD